MLAMIIPIPIPFMIEFFSYVMVLCVIGWAIIFGIIVWFKLVKGRK